MKRDKVVMKWNKKELDWHITWPDRAGKSLSGPFFDMTKTTGHRTDWGKDLVSMLMERGYDPTTFQISVKKKLAAPTQKEG